MSSLLKFDFSGMTENTFLGVLTRVYSTKSMPFLRKQRALNTHAKKITHP